MQQLGMTDNKFICGQIGAQTFLSLMLRPLGPAASHVEGRRVHKRLILLFKFYLIGISHKRCYGQSIIWDPV